MCGIVGYVGKRNALPILLDGLKKLEYRGYDSAGLAFDGSGVLVLQKAEGKLAKLEQLIRNQRQFASFGIGHTRWATHGRPSTENAHPHTDCTGSLAVVHNGIIENYLELKNELISEGPRFHSETDTEVIVHLIEKYSSVDAYDVKSAIRQALQRVQGSFAIGVVSTRLPGRIFAARRFSPLIVGLGKGEYFLASDTPAILAHTRDEIVISDDEIVELSHQGIEITDLYTGAVIEKEVEQINWSAEQVEKCGYAHFMLKEIHEQPAAIRETLLGRVKDDRVDLSKVLTKIDLRKIEGIHIVACGTSYHAGLAGKYMIEALTDIPVEVELASEYRYRKVIGRKNTLVIAISQSGETADTIAAVKTARSNNWQVLGICNVVGSNLTRLADDCLFTKAGPEIGVASTKAFTSQLAGLALFAVYCAQQRDQLDDASRHQLVDALKRLPGDMERALNCEARVLEFANEFKDAKTFLYLGRWINYPVALEGALKLKEISYINAQGYAAGEMKHGPIALIEQGVPVVVMAPHNHVYEKLCSNMEEVRARGGSVIAITDENVDAPSTAQYVVKLPRTHDLLAPVLQVVPLQLIAYHIAVLRGCDVDQPRNLAKSVTVE